MTSTRDNFDEFVVQARKKLLATSNGDLSSAAVANVLRELDPLLDEQSLARYTAELFGELVGFGPLDALLDDSAINDICVNGPGPVFIERDGIMLRTDVLLSREQLDASIERILAPLGLRVDRLSPIVDARLPDGSRVHVTLAPLAVDGPYLAIRRFRQVPFILSDYCDLAMLELLVEAVTRKDNIVVCGGTGAGKTSFLNALAAWIPDDQRIATIEDTAELRMPQSNVVRLEARAANSEGVGAVSMRELLRASLRLRPDRLVVGEVRGAEAFDMVQALNTGHAGSMSSVHANSVMSAANRLATLCVLAESDLPHAVALDLVHEAVQLYVHVRRLTDGRRVVDQVWNVGDESLYVRNSDEKDAA